MPLGTNPPKNLKIMGICSILNQDHFLQPIESMYGTLFTHYIYLKMNYINLFK